MQTHLQILRHQRTAARTRLRGVARIHHHHFATSLFHFVAKQLLELAQPCIGRAQGQVRIAEHEFEREVFDSHQAIGIGDLPGNFVPKVSPLVLDSIVMSSHQKSSFAATMTALRPARKSALGHSESLQATAQPPGILQGMPVTEGQQRRQPHINPNLRSLKGQ